MFQIRLKHLRYTVVLFLYFFSATLVAQDIQQPEPKSLEGQEHVEWTRVKDVEKLKKFMDGLSFERPLVRGKIAKAEFFADGTSLLHAWGATFHRTWDIKEDGRICITTGTVIDCYDFEISNIKAGLFRAHSVKTDAYSEFTVTDRRTIDSTDYSKTTSTRGGLQQSALTRSLQNCRTRIPW